MCGKSQADDFDNRSETKELESPARFVVIGGIEGAFDVFKDLYEKKKIGSRNFC